MLSEDDKSEDELAAFRRFLTIEKLYAVESSIRKGNPNAGEPDVLCELPGIGSAAFEMTKACSPDFERAVASAGKEPLQVPSGDVDVARTLRSKIAKTYNVPFPIGLIIYDNGTIAKSHATLRDALEYELRAIGHKGPFRRIWLMTDRIVSEIGSREVADDSKEVARELLNKSTRVANRTLARFADWLMIGLATATTFYVTHWQAIANLVSLGWMHCTSYLLAIALSLGVIARFLRHSVESGLAATKFSIQTPKRLDASTILDTYAKGLVWFPYRMLMKARLDPDTREAGRLAKLSQWSALFVWTEAIAAILALFALAIGFNS